MDAASLPSSNLRRAQHEQLTEECAALEVQIRQLELDVHKKRDMLTEKQGERSRLAPVYTLPDDIWFEVLETAFLHHFPRCGDSSSAFTSLPIAFSHVSRRFREVALALPTVWACIHIHAHQSLSYSNMLQEQLRRSQNRPISITFICRGPSEENLPVLYSRSFPSEEFTIRFEACWKLLLQHAHRWRHLSFWAEHDLIIKELLDNPHALKERVSMPQLANLDVFVGIEGLYGDKPSRLTLEPIMQETPRLSALRLRGVFPSSISAMTLSNITELSLIQLDVKLPQLEQILMATAGTLSALFLDTIGLRHIEHTTTPLCLPHLRHLVIKDVVPFDDCARRFSSGAPNLVKLDIGAPYPNTIPDFLLEASIRNTIVFPSVKTLHLFSLYEDEPVSLFDPTLLEFFPVLEHIIIHDEKGLSFTLRCLEAIQRSLDAPLIGSGTLPPLKTIWVSQPADEEVFRELARMIRRKTALGCPFEEVGILQRPDGFNVIYDDVMAEEAGEGDGDDERDNESEWESEDEEEEAILLGLRYKVDDWWSRKGDRTLDWDVLHECPALPFWI